MTAFDLVSLLVCVTPPAAATAWFWNRCMTIDRNLRRRRSHAEQSLLARTLAERGCVSTHSTRLHPEHRSHING